MIDLEVVLESKYIKYVLDKTHMLTSEQLLNLVVSMWVFIIFQLFCMLEYVHGKVFQKQQQLYCDKS